MSDTTAHIKRVAVSAASFVKNATLVRELRELSEFGFEVWLNPLGHVMTREELIDFWRETKPDAAIVGTELVDAVVLDAAPGLKVVAKYGVGLDNVDEVELARRGIALAWTGGVNKRAVSELVLAFALGHFRNAGASIDLMRQGQWVKDGGRQLSNLRVGIVGFGHVGSDLASLLAAFGSDVVCHDILDKAHEAAKVGARQVSYDDLLAHSDMITFHVPATALTRGMFGAREIEIVKETALIVNTSRGSVLDFDATTQALLGGRIGGLAVDVYPSEPFKLSPELAACSRFYATPHIGGNTREAVLAMGRSAIDGIRTFPESKG